MIISKDIAVWLKIISTAPNIATKLFNKKHCFLWGKKDERSVVKQLLKIVKIGEALIKVLSFLITLY